MTSQKSQTILAVDLDHTLIDIDMIYIGLKYLLIHKIYLLPILIILFFFKGKMRAKKYLYDNTIISLRDIPFNNSIIKFIESNKSFYDHTILISGSYHKYVEVIANSLNIFDSFKGTSIDINMVGANKLTYLNAKFNDPIFDYIGDSKKDIPIWEEARKVFVVDHGNIIKFITHLDYKIISKRY